MTPYTSAAIFLSFYEDFEHTYYAQLYIAQLSLFPLHNEARNRQSMVNVEIENLKPKFLLWIHTHTRTWRTASKHIYDNDNWLINEVWKIRKLSDDKLLFLCVLLAQLLKELSYFTTSNQTIFLAVFR
jgi:hypothetical protein